MTRIHESAASRLLDREMPEEYREQWTAIVAAQKQTVDVDRRSALVFRVGAEWLSISTTVLQEIAEAPQVHRLPHRRGGILNGLVCVRGELLLSIALEVLLNVEKVPGDKQTEVRHDVPKLLICDRKGSRFAFPVNEVSRVHTYRPRDLREVPATLARSTTRHTAGILQIGDRTVGHVDDERLFQYLDKNIA